jgi:AcrR family transcriptional regulator
MRYEKGHKEATRQRILETAAARFRKDGIESVGVADLMAEAGLTHGGFYSHFASKEELVREAMNAASSRSQANFAQRIAESGLEGWIRFYLSPSHRDHPERGCSAAALGAELARHPMKSREGFAENMGRVTKAIEGHLPATMSPAEKKKTAVGIFATLIGALQMARTVPDQTISQQIMEAGIATALSLAHIQPTLSNPQS